MAAENHLCTSFIREKGYRFLNADEINKELQIENKTVTPLLPARNTSNDLIYSSIRIKPHHRVNPFRQIHGTPDQNGSNKRTITLPLSSFIWTLLNCA